MLAAILACGGEGHQRAWQPGCQLLQLPLSVLRPRSGAPDGRLRCWHSVLRRVSLRRCVGRQFCTIPATDAMFGGDPCPRVQRKTLWVRYL